MRGWHPSQVGVRALLVLLPLLALACALPTGWRPSVGLWVVLGAAALAGAASPDSGLSLAAPAVVVAAWALLVPDPLSAWLLVAGTLLVLAHALAATAELGPPQLPLTLPVLVAGVGRGLLVLPALPLAWLLARATAGEPAPTGVWLSAAVAALALLGLAAAALGAGAGPPRAPGSRPVGR